MSTYLFIKFQPGRKSFIIHILEAKVPHFPKADSLNHLCERDGGGGETVMRNSLDGSGPGPPPSHGAAELPGARGASSDTPGRPPPHCLSLTDVNHLLFSWPHCAACGILVPRPGIEPGPPAVKAPRPNHWTSREVPETIYF